MAITSKRIEFIDAMRGLTMLLVVYSHIITVGYAETFSGDIGITPEGSLLTFNDLFVVFRMPLFFFISGFILYKQDFEWSASASLTFIWKKAKVQLIPTAFFMLLFVYMFDRSLVTSIYHPAKAGYWFTITLFEYFVIYVILRLICNKLGKRNGIDWLILCIAIVISFAATVRCLTIIGIADLKVIGLLGIEQLVYFVFFTLGTLVRKHYSKIRKLADNKYVIGAALVAFFGFIIFKIKEGANGLGYSIGYMISRAIGLLLVFTFFMKNEGLFTQDTKLGRVLQYIGRRTLDIYLLHYFFLPRNLEMVGKFFADNPNPTIELFVSLALATLVIALCLLMSKIIRMSPFLAHWLFGVKERV